MWTLIRKNRPFGRLLLSSLVSELGSHFTYMLMIVLSYEEHRSMVTTMGIAIASSIGALVFGSLAGVWVERWNPVRVMVVANLLQALLIGALFWLPVNMWIYYMVAFALAVVRSFLTPAWRKYQVHVVDESDMMNANASIQATRESLKIIGPILAVAVLGLVPKDSQVIGYLIDAVSYVLCAVVLFGLPAATPTEAQATGASGGQSFREQWAEGFRPLKHPILAAVAGMFVLILVGISGADVIFTAHVTATGNESLDVGYLFAALSAGLILASVFGTKFFSRWPLAIRLGGATLAIGLCELWIGVSGSLLSMAAAAFVLGLFNSIYNISASTYMQVTVPRAQIGRFFGLMGSIFSTAMLLGLALNGLLGVFLTPQAVLYWTGGVLSLAGVLSMFVITIAERRYKQQMADTAS